MWRQTTARPERVVVVVGAGVSTRAQRDLLVVMKAAAVGGGQDDEQIVPEGDPFVFAWIVCRGL